MIAAGVVGLIRWTDRPPAARTADAPPADFSEARALPVLHHLADSIGLRVMGTPGRDSAAAYLARQLAGIPGVEIAIQDTVVSRLAVGGGYAIQYRPRNVLARLPGELPDAVIVSAHYDSPPESVGASDNAASVAAAIEVLRALAAGRRPHRTVILNLNDGEEIGLLGVPASLGHPWMKDASVFINLEASGVSGRSVLFQTGPGDPWLAAVFAQAAPYPFGNVIGQEIFQSGLIPSDTDFRIYRDEGHLKGYDFARIVDGYGYHTTLDRSWRIAPGSIQHMGANTLALVRRLASSAPAAASTEPGIYYDFLGLVMLAYPASSGRWLGLAVALLAVLVLLLAVARGATELGHIVAGTMACALGAILGLVFAVSGGLALGFVFHRPHGWYAAPSLAWLAFGSLAMSGLLLAHALWEWRHFRGRRSRERQLRAEMVLGAWSGTLLLWTVALGLLSTLNLGISFLALWWTGCLAAGLTAATIRPARSLAFLAASCLLPGLLTLQLGLTLVDVFVPIAGRSLTPVPLDGAIAGLVATTVITCGFGVLIASHAEGRLTRAALAWLTLGVAGCVMLAFRRPYTADRPQRVWIEQRQEDGQDRILFLPQDYPSLAPAISAIPRVEPVPAREGWLGRAFEARWSGPALPSPAVTVLSAAVDSATGQRVLGLRITGGPFTAVDLRVPAGALVGWSFSDSLPTPLPHRAELLGRVWAPGADSAGWNGWLRLRTLDSVDIEVVGHLRPAATPALDSVRSLLPSWVTSYEFASSRRRIRM